jgi:hypothetical protein
MLRQNLQNNVRKKEDIRLPKNQNFFSFLSFSSLFANSFNTTYDFLIYILVTKKGFGRVKSKKLENKEFRYFFGLIFNCFLYFGHFFIE